MKARPASRWTTVPAAAFAALLVGCIGPNPDFSERVPGTSSGAMTTSGATTATVTTASSSEDITPDLPDTTLTSGTSTGSASTTTSSGAATEQSASDTSSTTDRGPPCEEYSEDALGGPLDLIFVVDRSASMMSPWDHDGDDLNNDGFKDSDPPMSATPPIARWVSVRQAIEQISQRFDASVHMGLAFYPSKDATMAYGPPACSVADPIELGLAPQNSVKLVAALPKADAALAGARPAAAAALAAVMTLSAGDPDARKKILYLSGGAANCTANAADNQTLLETLDEELDTVVFEATFGAKILTHVIGVGVSNAVSPVLVDSQPDGVNPHALLNTLAVSGGTAKAGPEKFWATNDDNELLTALDTSIRHGLSCTVQLQKETGFPEATEVLLAGKKIPHVLDCAGEDGWYYNIEGPYYDKIELCGKACAEFQEHGVVTVNYFCMAG